MVFVGFLGGIVVISESKKLSLVCGLKNRVGLTRNGIGRPSCRHLDRQRGMRGLVSGLGTVRVGRFGRCAGQWEGWRVIVDCF